MLAGAGTGAVIGVAVAGPVGVVVGGSVGAVLGALGSSAAGSEVKPGESSNAGTAPTDTVQVHTKASAGDALPPLSKADI